MVGCVFSCRGGADTVTGFLDVDILVQPTSNKISEGIVYLDTKALDLNTMPMGEWFFPRVQ